MTTETPCNGCKALKSDPWIGGMTIVTTMDPDANGACEFTEGIGCEQIKTCKLAGSTSFSLTPDWGNLPVEIKENWPAGVTYTLTNANPQVTVAFTLGNHDCGSGEKVVFTIKEVGPTGRKDLGVVKVKCTGC